jgi:hypothetical protein
LLFSVHPVTVFLMNEFTCSHCGIIGLSTLFAKDKRKVTGLSPYCIPCKRILRNENAAKHRDTNRARSARWYRENAERMAKRAAQPEARRRKAEYMRAWRKAHPDYHVVYEHEHKAILREARRRSEKARLSVDLSAKLAKALRTRLRSALKQNQRRGSAVRDLGCTIPELRRHLESQFLPGMSWENWSRRGWHIDHIRPLVSFDLTDPEQLKQAVHFSNLRPLWQHDNQSKDARARTIKTSAAETVP